MYDITFANLTFNIMPYICIVVKLVAERQKQTIIQQKGVDICST